ncbi:lauroyl-Kdo(2)-lipid IV(A) myristoyltransferase [Vibrio sp. SCSIO 43137]|uniref:lauroyl-Kdo(2)-lipid IV(A) myristoyltransferase n=1 Tax=Vibrio sp. SCSIO 43137 TaxID=3021011 RepID=UPI002308220A|nr:lauroyl-Kdo(2)-lipid IV(A) myristoyltransferase [Vibrio sp. SCSIO 43137]WCE29862.1 lauroyl-Kdo(2)-lipid IV(A) myristoyltransferase [Vibrio sp. SCSIO 43137]
MQNSRNDFDPKAYNPTFKWKFLLPSNWGTWLLIFITIPIALLPNSVRCWLARLAALLMLKKTSTACKRAWVNLSVCFPTKNRYEKVSIIRNGLTTGGAYLLGFASLTIRSRHWLEKKCIVQGIENLTKHTDKNENVILLVPHTWTIDVPAILFASKGLPVVGFVKQQKNELGDWLMHKQRIQYGGRIYERSSGIKPFIKSIKQGYLGYYLPDQDHGPDNSVFVDFFSAIKATLPGLGKLAKISNAKVVPIFSSYNVDSGQYQIDIYPALKNFPTGSDEGDAKATNDYIESVVSRNLEQYMWNLSLLKTQADGSNLYKSYLSKDPL